jgi:hypothetical protein
MRCRSSPVPWPTAPDGTLAHFAHLPFLHAILLPSLATVASSSVILGPDPSVGAAPLCASPTLHYFTLSRLGLSRARAGSWVSHFLVSFLLVAPSLWPLQVPMANGTCQHAQVAHPLSPTAGLALLAVIDVCVRTDPWSCPRSGRKQICSLCCLLDGTPRQAQESGSRLMIWVSELTEAAENAVQCLL